jgi:ABC-type multidrug transport system fused ATPase/permease subunit
VFRRQAEIRDRLLEIIEKFRQKGAISPEKAMTAEELGLPPRFEEVMKRRLGRLGIFVEVDGKYYLSEEKVQQLEKLPSGKSEAQNSRKRIMNLRLIQLFTVALSIIILLVNFFVQSWELRLVSVAILVVWLLLLILQFYYLSRVRRHYNNARGISSFIS